MQNKSHVYTLNIWIPYNWRGGIYSPGISALPTTPFYGAPTRVILSFNQHHLMPYLATKQTRQKWRYRNSPRVSSDDVLASMPLILASISSSPLTSSSERLRGDHVILFSFFRRLRAFANHVDTCVRVILVMIASMIFSPFVG